MLVFLALGLAAIAGVVSFSRLRPTTSSGALSGAQHYPVLMPDLCKMRTQLQAGNRTDAYNLFYRRAHPALHALVSSLKSGDPESKALSSSLQRAKSTVEAGLINYPPALTSDVDKLLGLTQPALIAVDPTVPNSC